jgi:hypothetical protein
VWVRRRKGSDVRVVTGGLHRTWRVERGGPGGFLCREDQGVGFWMVAGSGVGTAEVPAREDDPRTLQRGDDMGGGQGVVCPASQSVRVAALKIRPRSIDDVRVVGTASCEESIRRGGGAGGEARERDEGRGERKKIPSERTQLASAGNKYNPPRPSD